MTAIRRMFGWLGRKAIIFVALVAALIAHQLLQSTWQSHGALGKQVAMLRGGEQTLDQTARTLIDGANSNAVDAQRWSVAQLDAAVRAAEKARDEARRGCGGDLAAAFRKGAQGVIDNRTACMSAVVQQRQVVALTALRDTADSRRVGESLPDAVRRQAAIMKRATALNRRAVADYRRLNTGMLNQYRYREEIAQRSATAAHSARTFADAKRRAEAMLAAQRKLSGANAAASGAIAGVRAEYRDFVAKRTAEYGGNAIEQIKGAARRVGLSAKLRIAAIALTVIIASPFLIRLFCYFVLAPLAMRRAAIRLAVPGGAGVAIPPSPRSATSVAVRLAPDEELLVRQDYLQTSSLSGPKRTKLFLSWRTPVTSLATGLSFLTRIRGDGETTTVSATRDGLAEVTVLTLAAGAACVLQPRALAAVAKPVGRRLRITRHWRLGSLNAWLTLQLRFLVFHGPARLVLKGGRGVRVEPAERGRVFGQDQLVGFSADLAYAVTRTETFWPYFLGREPLLKDRIEGGTGMLIIEEAPLAGRSGEVRRGLEGMIDAGMKVFGM